MVRCFALIETVNGHDAGTSGPNKVTSGPNKVEYGPVDLRSAYNLPSSGGAGQTVAIVDAFDDPNEEADLATYRANFGLGPCTTSNGCFKKIEMTGGKRDRPPGANKGWAGEISLDLDMVSATCPQCHILLVEAYNPLMTRMGPAQNTAASLGATEINDSWGSFETRKTAKADGQFFSHPGIAQVVAVGDTGYGVSYPASSPNVTSVGGTALTRDSSPRGWSETVWNDQNAPDTFGATGSGCSRNEPKPAWQKDTGCAHRTDNDVAAVADPNTPVLVYDSYRESGWLLFGGTSVSAPIVAGIYALAGNAASLTGASLTYTSPSSLNDITSGNDGTCSPAYLCTAGPGYDGPSGNGSPNGLGAF
jgi:subtilase family serine protease